MIEIFFRLNEELANLGQDPSFDICLEKTAFYDLALELKMLNKFVPVLESGAGETAATLGWIKLQGPASNFIIRRKIDHGND